MSLKTNNMTSKSCGDGIRKYLTVSKIEEKSNVPATFISENISKVQNRSRSAERSRCINRAPKTFSRDRSAESHVMYRARTSEILGFKAELSFVGQECHRLPSVLGKLYGAKVQSLDLSYNSLTTLAGVEQFPSLEELILDNNQLSDSANFPTLPKLHTLSLNKNCIINLDLLLVKINHNLPALRYLSLLGNKACPNQLSDREKDEEDYQRYRYYVLYHLPHLQFLDSRNVGIAEKNEAQQRGQFMRVIRPTTGSNNCSEEGSSHSKSNYTPLPSTRRDKADHQGAYGKCRYRYSGKHSEGNRFIQNSDL